MKRILNVLLVILMVTAVNSTVMAGKKRVQVSTSEQDAKIFIDGQLMGNGQVEVVILKESCVTIRVVKVGFLVETITFCNKKSAAKPPKTYYIEMRRDDAYDASIQTDIANIDISIRTTLDELATWKLISQIVTQYFDVIEIADRETGYLRTSWELKSFTQNTIRTRLIIKLGDTNPLTYKIKLVSEESRYAQTSVKSDELYREWDRVLRKFEGLIEQMESRLTK